MEKNWIKMFSSTRYGLVNQGYTSSKKVIKSHLKTDVASSAYNIKTKEFVYNDRSGKTKSRKYKRTPSDIKKIL